MRHLPMSFSIAAFTLATTLFGCSSKDDAVALGDMTVGTQTFHVEREGPEVAAGAKTRFVLKVATGAKPTSVTGWVGLESAEGSTKYKAAYDEADGDFDDDVTCPTPLPTGSKIWFDVMNGDTKTTGSIAIK
ncbi:MAG: hypothetical protein ABI175_24205 [Polyangiales bacterium]